MSLKDYVAELERVISEAPFVSATSLSYEERPPATGIVRATILFMDGSELDLREFVFFRPQALVVKYAYNYRIGRDSVFRYDNANDPSARGLPTYP